MMPNVISPFGTNQTVHPFVMVIFGATGDLTVRKLMPALYNLYSSKILPERFMVVGFARRELTNSEFRKMMIEAVHKFSGKTQIKNDILTKLAKNLYYQKGYFEELTPYQNLITQLTSFDKEIGACITRFFYLATPPINYSIILKNLSISKLSQGCGQGSNKWTRILIEKPFGKDLQTAKELEAQLAKTFSENQIYRIDHYLAKETIQNILAFRFANSIFESLWNKNHIDNIQITLFEAGGIGTRGLFYEGTGALKDVVQNHLMAMLAFTCMEQPVKMDVDSIRVERVRVLQSIRKIENNHLSKYLVRGQYGEGIVNNHHLLGYRQEKNVNPQSQTETYVALKLYIDNKRWQGVPIYLRTGKRMPRSVARISIQFKKPLRNIFKDLRDSKVHSHENVLTFRVHPREGISLQILSKKPGLGYTLRNVKMDFSYEATFGKKIFDSYERLLIDSMLGDQTLFATNAGFNATWKLMTSIIEYWKSQPKPIFPNYRAGSWGPIEAQQLIERDGRHWLLH